MTLTASDVAAGPASAGAGAGAGDVRRLPVGGIDWRYRVSGPAGPTLLVLTGALGQADFAIELFETLAGEIRVIAPDYPDVDSLDTLIAGLEAILAAEGVEQAHILGGSFGGLVAQAFAQAKPGRLTSLILSHTGAPRHASGVDAALTLLALLPAGMLRSLFSRRVRPAVRIGGEGMVRRFDGVARRMTKRALLGRVRVAAEASRRLAPDKSTRSALPVLLIQSDDDPLIRSSDRAALAARFSDAETRMFSGAGHLPALLQPAAFAAAVTGFVRRAEQARRQ